MVKQDYTFNALDSYFLNTATGQLNVDYLREQIYTQLDVVWRNTEGSIKGKSFLHGVMCNNRRKTSSIAWLGFVDFANTAVRQEYGEKYQVSNYQLKNYIKKYGLTFEEVFNPLVDDVLALRFDILGEDC